MCAQFSKKALFSKVITVILVVGFIFTTLPISYADMGTLRPPAARNNNPTTTKIAEDLAAGRISILSNIVSLHTGQQTGGYNIRHAILGGANGGIFNHSERRGRLEKAMNDMLKGISYGISRHESIKEIEDSWKEALKKEEGLSDAQIEATLEWLRYFRGLRADSRLIEIERLARRLVNYVMNLQLKEVVADSDKYEIMQTVLCVGETLAQYDAERTQEVLRQDLEEILAGITEEQAGRSV